MIDFTKPVRTKSGRAVRILATDRKCEDRPILALVDNGDEEIIMSYTKEGKYYSREDHGWDLENVPEVVEVWINLYKSNKYYAGTTVYENKAQAMGQGEGFNYVGAFKVKFEI